MRLKYKLMLAALLFVFVFSERVSAAQTYVIHYLEIDNQSGELWRQREISLGPNIGPEEKALELFRELFALRENNFSPTGTEIISVQIKGDLLTLNVSKEISSYGGGSYYERCLRDQIVKTALDIPGIKCVTLLIENEPTFLPEGTQIFKYYWEEPKCQDATEEITEPYGM